MSNDRISYINSINFHDGQQDNVDNVDVVPAIIRYFDGTMGLYGIIGANTASIDATTVDGSMMFCVKLKSVFDADALESILEQTTITFIYFRSFSISYTRHSDLEVYITVKPITASPS
jgi:hypothetical protein